MMAPPAEDVILLDMMIKGRVILPVNEREYKEQLQKAHNAEFWSRKPAFFVLCHDTEDVLEVLSFTRKHKLPISVRSGAHSACGSSCRDDTVVIDLAAINHVEYNAETEEVTLGPGATLSDVNVHLMRHDRLTPVGIAPPTGMGGLALHGGIGWLTHKFGTSTDQITNMNLILADGTIKNLDFSSEGDDRELFFAARGAVSSLGICTSFTMRTYPMEMVTAGFWMMKDDANYTATRKLIKHARDLVNAQEESGNRTLSGSIFMGNVPPDPSVAADVQGAPCSMMLICGFGTDEATRAMVEMFVDREIVFGKAPSVMPFGIFNQILSGLFLNFPPFAHYWKASMVGGDVPDERIDAFANLWSTHEPWMGASLVGIEFIGGRMGYDHAKKINQGNEHCVIGLAHDWRFNLAAMVYTPRGLEFDEKRRGMAKGLNALVEDMRVTANMNFHQEFENNEEAKRMQEFAFEKAERIKNIKAKVDPNNIFNRAVITVARE